MKKRLAEIDMVRGISIIVVVAVHANMPDTLHYIVSIFCLPLFFMVAGYLFSPSKYLFNIIGLIKSRVVTLLVPYFSACVLSYIYWIITNQVGEYQKSIIWYDPLLGFLNGNVGYLINFPLWYLTCLFCSQIIFCLTQKFLRRYDFNVTIQVLFYLLLGFIGYGISRIVFLPWGLDIALTIQLFLFVGYKFKENRVLENMKSVSKYTIVFVFLVILTAFINNNQVTSVALREYNNFLLFYIGGISASILVLSLIKMISRYQFVVNPLTYIGSKSLSILIFHVGFSFILLSYIDHFLFKTLEFSWIITTIGGVLISIALGLLLKKQSLLNLLFNGKKISSYRKYETNSVDLKSHTI